MKTKEELTLDAFISRGEGTLKEEIATSLTLPKGWRWVKLGNVSIRKMGGTPRTNVPKYWGGNIIWITAKTITEERKYVLDSERKITKEGLENSNAKLVPKGSILLVTTGATAGKLAIAGTEVAINQQVTAIIPKKDIDNLFLFYVLKFLKSQLLTLGGKTTFKHINQKKLANLLIPLPPIEEQKRIVARIEEILSRVEQAKRLREGALKQTEQIMQSALHEIFSEAEEKWGNELLPNVCKINPSKKEISNLPDDLKVTFVPMSSVNEITGSIENPSIRLLKDVRKGYTYFRENDVLFAKITPCMENGKAAVAKNLVNGIGFGSTEFHVIRPSNKILAEWIYYFIRQKSFRELAARNMTGSVGQQRVPEDFLKSVRIPLPPIEEQKQIVSYLNSLQEKVLLLRKHQEETKKELEKIVPVVLDKAFKGEL